jgi:caffeoyl-CoA O-methyltransferase
MSKMIVNPEAYFGQFIPERNDLLLGLEAEARREAIPIVGPVVGEFLSLLVRAMQAKKILELGTATGYSAIYLAHACASAEARVVTIEKNQKLALRAQINFQKAGLDDRIEIRMGDARDILLRMEGPFDFIFMDIDKSDYQSVLRQCQRLLRKGGLLVTDNVGFTESNDFNQAIFNNPNWKSVHLLAFLPLHSPEKDGLCLALRI